MKKKILAGIGVLVFVLIAVLFVLSNLNNDGTYLLTADSNDSDTSPESSKVSSESLYTDNSQNESEDLEAESDTEPVSASESETNESYEETQVPDDGSYEDGLLVVSDEKWFEQYSADYPHSITMVDEPKEEYVLYVPSYLDGIKVEKLRANDLDECVKVVFPDGVSILNLTGKKIETIVFGKVSNIEEELDLDSDIFYMYYPAIHIWHCPALKNIYFADDEGIISFSLGSGCEVSYIDLPEKTIALNVAFCDLPLLKSIELPEFLQLMFGSFVYTYIEYLQIPENCYIIDQSITNSEHIKAVVISAQNAAVTESFNECPNLEYVVVEGMGTTFENCFDGSDNVTLVVKEDSAALEYAIENNISYVMYDEFDMSIIDEIKSESNTDGE